MVYSKKLGKPMKTLLLSILLATGTAFSSAAYTATLAEIQSGVSIYANAVTGSSGEYYDQSFKNFNDSSPINANDLSAAVTGSDMSSYAWTPDFHIPSGPANAYLDLSFGSNIYNGEGADLILFFAGNGTDLSYYDKPVPYQFSIDVGADGSQEGGILGITETTTTSALYGNKFFASYALIDLDDFGFDQTTALGDIRIYLGDETMPALAGLGAYNLTPVPLPLSSVLFGSGLALLSVFRKKVKQL